MSGTSIPNQIYEELEANVASLTIEEAREEILECARYGEYAEVDCLLRHFHDKGTSAVAFVDSTDASGSTALHKAACNGHLETVKLLIKYNAKHLSNKSGNTPLHWASGSSHTTIVKLLLEEYSSIDVLQKNKFGKSALTEGFSAGNVGDNDEKTKTVGALLEHNTASEDRLIGDSVQNEEDIDPSKNGITHELVLANLSSTLLVRELPIAHADNPFGTSDNPADDTTGLGIWCASLVMARWLASEEMCLRFGGKILCELGAGCGVPSLACTYYASSRGLEPPRKVYITDLNRATMKNLQFNIELNGNRCPGRSVEEWTSSVLAKTMDWSDEKTWPTGEDDVDYVIGSDLIYHKEIVPLLTQTVKGLLGKKSGPKSFLYVAPDSGRDGLPEFIKGMKKEGFRCVKNILSPDDFLKNPLSNGDEDECFLHFGELRSSTYILYEFLKK